MTTYREIVYLVLDELKINSDDSYFTEEHVAFLADKYRAFILKQRYSDIKKSIPRSNYQQLCLDLIEVPAISGEPCEGGSYLRTKYKVAIPMLIGNPTIYPIDAFQGSYITYISKERMRYVGHNKYLKNIIYAALAPDGYLYFKSSNPQYLYLEKVRMDGIFESSIEASKLGCGDVPCDILDFEFPLEAPLIPPVIELIVKELTQAEYKPEDMNNNTKDEFGDVKQK